MAVFGWLSRACTKQGAQWGGKLVGLNNTQDMQSAGPGHTDWQSIIHALSSVGLPQKHPAADTRSSSILFLHATLVETTQGMYTRYTR